MNNAAVLHRLSFFSGVLGKDDLDALATASRRADYDQGATIVREGDRGASMFVIVRGAVTVSVRDGGNEREVATLHDGEVIGEMSLLTGAPRAATVVALRPTVTVEIPKAALAPILARAPELVDRFAAVIDKRKAELDRLYGPLHWMHPSEHTAALANAIRRFFASENQALDS